MKAMKYIGILAAIIFLFAADVHAQTVQLIPVPRQVILSNTGTIQPNMVLYVFLAGTSTAASVYTDFTGTVLLSNPVAADSSGRLPQIWATNQLIKLVACVQNDGATCAAGDTLWTADGINAFGGGSAGSSSSPFISASSNPATTGILRLASGDTTCWRNAANNANLCWSKNANDLLSWGGSALLFTEIAAPTGVAASDLLWPDSTAHRWKMSNNGGAATQVVASGIDINTSDQVTSTHLSSALPVAQGGTGVTTSTGSGAVVLATSPALVTPTIGGTTITNVPQMTWDATDVGSSLTGTLLGNPIGTFPVNSAITVKDFTVAWGQVFGGCTTTEQWALEDNGSAIDTITVVNNTNSTTHSLSLNVAAGHTLTIVQTRNASGGCTGNMYNGGFTVVYIMQ